jgi:thiol-disulfide isomerase/thioredoxin
MDFKTLATGVVAVAAIGFALRGFMTGGGRSADGLLAAGSVAPAFSLSDPTGVVHSLEDQRGRLVLLDFWATWCGPCRMAMPSMERLHKKHGGRLRVFGVNFAENGDAAGYMREQGFTYTLLKGGDAVAQQYGVSGIPCFYLIDGAGKVLWAGTGYSSKNERELEERIDAALASMGR